MRGLIKTARARYRESLAKAEAAAAAKQKALTASYAKYLTSLKDRFDAAAKTGEVAQVVMELESVLSGGGEAATAFAEAISVKGVTVPKELRGQLRLLYTFEDGPGRLVRDHSGWRQDGELSGEVRGKDPREGSTCAFSASYDLLETKEIRIGSYWTVSVRALFPLEDKKEYRVLVSSAHGKHLVLVDATGVLGIQPKRAAGTHLYIIQLRSLSHANCHSLLLCGGKNV